MENFTVFLRKWSWFLWEYFVFLENNTAYMCALWLGNRPHGHASGIPTSKRLNLTLSTLLEYFNPQCGLNTSQVWLDIGNLALHKPLASGWKSRPLLHKITLVKFLQVKLEQTEEIHLGIKPLDSSLAMIYSSKPLCFKYALIPCEKSIKYHLLQSTDNYPMCLFMRKIIILQILNKNIW